MAHREYSSSTPAGFLVTSSRLWLTATVIATVISARGTRRKQKLYANKIKPIRKNGHLLLVTLLLANMIVNETLPVISDPVLGGGVQSVVVSTVLIVMYVPAHPFSVSFSLFLSLSSGAILRQLSFTYHHLLFFSAAPAFIGLLFGRGYFSSFGLKKGLCRSWSDDATSARLTRSREPRVAHVTSYPLSRRSSPLKLTWQLKANMCAMREWS